MRRLRRRARRAAPRRPRACRRPARRPRARRWREFWSEQLEDYDRERDRPDLDATSHMSVHLKWGEIHPRTMLPTCAGSPARARRPTARSWPGGSSTPTCSSTSPESARDYLRPEFARMAYDEPGDQLAAWQEGRTGFPIVDAGMRQLRATGWMHNRVRMIVASFLVKDLHVEWQHGARHFMQWLVDGDLASNQHGWQWTAGCGTDAAPYFRVFNPITPGPEVRPPGRLHPARGCPSCATPTTRTSPSTRSSTTRRSASRRWTGTRGSGDDGPPRARPVLRAADLRQRRLDLRRDGRARARSPGRPRRRRGRPSPSPCAARPRWTPPCPRPRPTA